MSVLDFDPRRAIHKGNPPVTRSSESGYAFLMVMFMVVFMIIASQVALQNVVTQGHRLREEELIWRGNQWVRAIRAYYHKRGYYPRTAEDLEDGLPELHFLRPAAYKDPVNTADGSWRFIYTNAAGQLIGSVRYATLQQMALMDLNGGQIPGGQQGASAGVPVSTMASSSGSAGNGNGDGSSSSPASSGGTAGASSGSAQSSAPNQGGASGPSGGGASPAQVVNPLAQLQPTGPVDGPVPGAFLTGVASKVDQASIKVYHGGEKYKKWEFIWNPIEDAAQAAQQGLNTQGGQPGQPTGTVGPGNGGLASPGGTESSPTPSPSQPPE
jgi:uncharacterized membrane protein YgcG